MIRAIVILGLIGTAAWAQERGAGYQDPPEDLPRAIAPQPVAFNHQIHVENNLACKDCHKTSDSRARAGLPTADDCMLCHQAIVPEHPEIEKLAALATQDEKLEWVRVYDAEDFVFFNHKQHVTAGVECVSCHGPVETRTVLAQELSVRMGSCMNCHKERGVSNECYVCHELGQ